MTGGGVDRWGPTQRAAKRVLDTLGTNDYATVITFSETAAIYDYEETLHVVTDKNRKKMQQWIDEQGALGGTNFRAGFEAASKSFKNAIIEQKTSGCLQIILFLTDGIDKSGFVADDLAALNLEGVYIFTYTFGADADKVLPKELACRTNAIWSHVPDGGDVENIMAKYYLLFAASIDTSQVRWVEYDDGVTGETLAAGCLPAFDESSVKALIGVACMDMNVIVDVPAFKEKDGYDETWKQMREAAESCARINFAATTLQRMRREASGSGGVCGSPIEQKCAGGSCEVDRTWTAPPSTANGVRLPAALSGFTAAVIAAVWI
eukprot:gnl/TRDRNA2_/TRDRNA2_175530_c5_seq9.p1 gnl/TRDRNA2_/TRDRNA2_175530_c5~~gnl/TRDRNA2_/TRDRNA2_175530_c5_seq9.p1  ORF type:complete len:337 (-),score=56.11 gnl/TRDRNA2_/TRDRNA2_175530_c5_seq9:67-1029(-)